MQQEPLIFTTKGNMPVSQLQYVTSWEDTPLYTKFVERYLLDGEVVRESAHVLAREGVSMEGQQAVL